jgi:hypothetical protein
VTHRKVLALLGAVHVSLYVAHFNLCRVHESLRITRTMAMGITDHIWTIGELIDSATAEPIEQRTP